MRAAAYCRVSTDTEDQLNSLQTQRQFFEGFLINQGHTLVKIYADEGISGTRKKNRKQFLQLMEDAKAGAFDIVCVKDISRLARNTLDFLESIRALKAMNIETLFITNNMTILGNSEFIPTVMAALAQEESANTSKRIKFGKKANAAKGRVPNFVYGYDKIKGDYFNLTVNEPEAATIRRIFRMYNEEGYGASKISSQLNSEGLRTKRGSCFSQNAIIRILTNEIYVGRVVNNKQETRDFLTGERMCHSESEWLISSKPSLQIISEADFEKARETLENRHNAFKADRQRHSNAHAFSTLIKCVHCGQSFRRSRYTYTNIFVKWVCSGRNANGIGFCPNSTAIDEAELLDQISQYLAGILRNRANITNGIIKEFRRIYNTSETAALNTKQINAELSRLKAKKSRELSLFTDGLINKQDLQERVAAISKRISVLEQDLELAASNVNKADVVGAKIQILYPTIERALAADISLNAALKQIIFKIESNAEGVVSVNFQQV
ncbi:MAG: recombinase family protein [Defluviitaleaceae bacterium]|nr:recombinase family protein [Defluviitaleaceae bacterium]